LLSEIITSKYQYGLPLFYRQEAMFKQYGIDLSRKTMAQWMMKSQLALQILYERLGEILLQQSVIQADETTLKVIGEAKTTCYMWLYCSGSDSPQTLPKDNSISNIVLYDYQNSRRGQCAADFLVMGTQACKWVVIKLMQGLSSGYSGCLHGPCPQEVR
jgi:hypothetical protein